MSNSDRWPSEQVHHMITFMVEPLTTNAAASDQPRRNFLFQQWLALPLVLSSTPPRLRDTTAHQHQSASTSNPRRQIVRAQHARRRGAPVVAVVFQEVVRASAAVAWRKRGTLLNDRQASGVLS